MKSKNNTAITSMEMSVLPPNATSTALIACTADCRNSSVVVLVRENCVSLWIAEDLSREVGSLKKI